MSEEELLFRSYKCSEKLYKDVQTLYSRRADTISQLSGIIAKLHEAQDNGGIDAIDIARAAGTGVSAVGSVLGLVGSILSPFTFGASEVLSGISHGASVVSDLTDVGCAIAEKLVSKDVLAEVQAVIDSDKEQVEVVKKSLRDFEKVCGKILKQLESKNTSSSFQAQLKRVWIEFKPQCKVRNVANLATFFMWKVLVLGRGAVRVVSSPHDAVQIASLGVERFGAEMGRFVKIAVRLIDTFGYKFLDGLFLGIRHVVDVRSLINTVVVSSNGSVANASVKMEEKLKGLRGEQAIWFTVFLDTSYGVRVVVIVTKGHRN